MSRLGVSPIADGAMLRQRLLRLAALTTLVSVAVGTVLFFFGLDLTASQMRIGALYVAGPACASTLLVALAVTARLAAPLQKQLAAGPTDRRADGLVRALNLPVLSALRVIVVQVPVFAGVALVLIAVANAQLGLGFESEQVFICLLTVLFVGTGHAIVEYFLVSRAALSVVRELQARGVGLDDDSWRRVIAVGMRRKFLFVTAFAVFTPMVVMGFSVLLKVERLMKAHGLTDTRFVTDPLRDWVVLLVAGTTAVMLYMAVVLAQEVMRSTEVMVHAMQKVQRNQLDTELTVMTTDEFAELYEGFNKMTTGLRERERLRDAFGRFVAPELAEEVMRHGVRLGGDSVECSVLFADIRGFTALSERLPPEAVVRLLNQYFAAVEPAIDSQGGWINKFGGDSLLAVFGAPVPKPDHARRAVGAARAMRAALLELNAEQAVRGDPPLAIGVGIATGTVIAGNVGSPRRMEYTVIGDVVNVAARLEALTKQVGRDVLLSESARHALGEDFEGVALEPARLAGKSEPVPVYALA